MNNSQQPLTVEELLNDRYKHVLPYPDSYLEVGDILYKFVFTGSESYIYTTNPIILIMGVSVKAKDVETHPNLFRRLEWWEEREEWQMPEYVKFLRNYHNAKKGDVKRIVCIERHGIWTEEKEGFNYSEKDFLPATADDYQAFISNQSTQTQ